MANERETVRVFVALDLPYPVKERLREIMADLASAIPSGVRWVDPAGIHLTLKFLGDVEANRVNDLVGAMSVACNRFGESSVSLGLSELGAFPNTRNPSVLWCGVRGELDKLARLQGLVDEALSDLGFPAEQRPFRPHLTLGRVNRSVPQGQRELIGREVSRALPGGSTVWAVNEIHLIRSVLTRQGAIYNSIGAAPLVK